MAVGDPDGFRAVSEVLVDPARTWRLCAQADAYGADSHTREALSRLPVLAYASLQAVLDELQATLSERL